MFPPDGLQTVQLFHLPKTGGQTQPYPSTADVKVAGFLIPMGAHQHALEGGSYMNPFNLFLDLSVDVRVGDKMVAGSTDYFVKNVNSYPFGGLQHKRCSVSSQP